jgi:glycolate oxidase FAD binding subunit
VALRGSAGGFELGVRFEGFEKGVSRDAQKALEVEPSLRSRAARLDAPEADAFWRRHAVTREPWPLRIRITALPAHLGLVDALLAPLLVTLEAPALAWYATLGVGFVSGNVALPAAALAALVQAREALVRLGGSLVVEAAVPELRAQFDAWGPAPSGIAVMQEIKRRFDPEGRLNPGRFVGGI